MKNKYKVKQWKPRIVEIYWYASRTEDEEEYAPKKEYWCNSTNSYGNYRLTPLFKTKSECQEFIDSLQK